MLKNTILFFAFGLFFFLGCSEKKLDLSGRAIQDSIPIYLKLAFQDTIPYHDRLFYNKKALRLIANQKNDSLKRVNLFKVANRYFNLNSMEKFHETSKITLQQSIISNDTPSIAKAYSYLGEYYTKTIWRDSAYSYYSKAEKLYRKLNDKSNLGGVYISIATLQGYANDFLGSELSAINALNILRDTEKSKVYDAYNILGFVSNELKDYEKALEYHYKALNLAIESKLTIYNEISNSLNNIGNVYQNQRKHKEAILKFEEALKDKSLIINRPNLHSILLDNLAYSKLMIRDYSQLPDMFFTSLKIRDSLNLNAGVIDSKIHLSEFYSIKKDTILSKKFAEEALTLSRHIKNQKAVLMCLTQLANIDKKNASIYSDEYIQLSDSLHFEERKMQNKFARIEFETDEIVFEKDKAIGQKWTILWVSVSLLLSGLLLYVFRMQQSKQRELLLLKSQQKANEEIYQLILSQQQKFDEGREKEKKRIAKELHDGIMNRLAGIRSSLFVLENKTDPETIEHCISQVAQIQEVEKEVRDIAHDLGNDAFSSKKDYQELLESLVAEFADAASFKIDLELSNPINWKKISAVVKMHVYRVLQESLHNIKKHAVAANATISIAEKREAIQIEIQDDGVGFDSDAHSLGLGIRSIRSRIEEMEGSFKITSSNSGTHIKISIPLYKQ